MRWRGTRQYVIRARRRTRTSHSPRAALDRPLKWPMRRSTQRVSSALTFVRSSGDSRRLRSQHTYDFQRNRGLYFRSQRIPRRPSRLYREIAAAISQRRLYFQISNTACILEANSRETPASAAKRKAYIVFLDRIGVPAR